MIASSRTLSGRLFSCTYAARKDPTVSFEVVRTLRTALIFSNPPRALILLVITSSTLCARALPGEARSRQKQGLAVRFGTSGRTPSENASEHSSTCVTEPLRQARDSGHACRKLNFSSLRAIATQFVIRISGKRQEISSLATPDSSGMPAHCAAETTNEHSLAAQTTGQEVSKTLRPTLLGYSKLQVQA